MKHDFCKTESSYIHPNKRFQALFPDTEKYPAERTVSGQSGKFPDSLDSFQTASEVPCFVFHDKHGSKAKAIDAHFML